MKPNERKTLADYPHLAAELDRERHPLLDPACIPHRSWARFHWVCGKDHTHRWSAAPANRTRQPGCPYCTGRKTDPKRSLGALYPELAQQWHPTRNGGLTSHDVTLHSSRLIWWYDPDHPSRVWRAAVSSRMVTPRTPWERGLRADEGNCLATTHPAVAKQFVTPVSGKRFSPRTVTAGSNRRAAWQCPLNPKHQWEAAIYTVVSARHSGCPYCTYRVSFEQVELFTGLSRHLPHLEFETGSIDEGTLKVPGWRCGFDARLAIACLLIDYDGSRFHSPSPAYKRDRRKVKAARRAGWSVIRIRPAPLKQITCDDVRVPHNFNRETYVRLVLDALKAWYRRRYSSPLFHLC